MLIPHDLPIVHAFDLLGLSFRGTLSVASMVHSLCHRHTPAPHTSRLTGPWNPRCNIAVSPAAVTAPSSASFARVPRNERRRSTLTWSTRGTCSTSPPARRRTRPALSWAWPRASSSGRMRRMRPCLRELRFQRMGCVELWGAEVCRTFEGDAPKKALRDHK